MTLMGLFSRNDDLPGYHGVIRDLTSGVRSRNFKRLAQGDIAVINAADIDRRFAQALIDAKPAAVVNLTEFSTGRIPIYGAQMMLDEGITLVENTGEDLLKGLRNGKKARLTEDGELFFGTDSIGAGTVLDLERAQLRFIKGKQALNHHMESFFEDAQRFVKTESPLLIDGLGVPDVAERISGCKVVIVTQDVDIPAAMASLKDFIKEQSPVLIAVDGAADDLMELGYKIDFIVANPEEVKPDTLRGGATVILPADAEGAAEGIDRIQELGIGGLTFPSSIKSSRDLALLLAGYHQADLIVLVSTDFTLNSVMRGTDKDSAAHLMVRAQCADRLVSSEAISTLYNTRTNRYGAWISAVLAVLLAIAVIVVVMGFYGSAGFVENIENSWNHFVQGVASSMGH